MGNARSGSARRAANECTAGGREDLFQQLAEGTINSGGFDLNGMWSPCACSTSSTPDCGTRIGSPGNQTALQ
jgi:hypothetical protein